MNIKRWSTIKHFGPQLNTTWQSMPLCENGTTEVEARSLTNDWNAVTCKDCLRLRRDPCPNMHRPHNHGNALEEHTCPFNVEMDSDTDTLCTCCEDCTQKCADDV